MVPAYLFAQTGDTDGDAPVTIHVVQRGENLFRIALRYGLTTEELAKANNITNPANILVGQRLVIPNPISIETELPAEPNVPGVIHTVQGGETLFRIAIQYGIDITSLQLANNITDPTLIYAGQQLLIPGIEAPELPINLPSIVSSLNVEPALFVEGRTGRIRITTTTACSVRGTFLDTNLVVATDSSGTLHTILIGIPIYTEAGTYALDLSFVPSANDEPTSLTLEIQVITGGYESQSITLPDDRLELLSPAVEENELNLLASITNGFTAERYFDGPLSLPAAAAMNSPFGTRRSYNGQPFDRYHNGADFAGAPGSPVLAAASGWVILADALNIRGTSIIIDHGWGVYTNYSHLNDRYVQLGDFVTAGQVIGTVGSTGRATGAHLHWEVWVHGVAVDPMQWVRESFP